ncbi:WD40-repeat-containing domain protein [Halteromyces radiatus]|uniref:WD40-repeat-containing domain protein n=1 Tax=Halteromyces radiatus TaxID=101107 RepID=UPI00221FE940|nr:WD40-repeat-containing domain protein [Halteromyces radiatus]KAI8092998.1 WD40-repeat-containing domain protein [Halteromyces radiatus]
MAPQPKRQKNDRDHDKKPIKDDEEKKLESLLFGGSEELWNATGRELELPMEDNNDDETTNLDGDASDDQEEAFFFDAGPGFDNDNNESTTMNDEIDYEASDKSDNEGSSSENSEEELDDDDQVIYQGKAAWQDEDDNLLEISLKGTNRLRKLRKNEEEDVISGKEYERRLRTQFNKMYPPPEWAQLPSEKKLQSKKRKGMESDSEDDYSMDEGSKLDEEERLDLLKSTLGILETRKSSTILSPDHVSIVRMKDANIMAPSSKQITALQFHPNAQVLLTAGLDRALRLFQIDGKVNHKIQSVHFKDTPIYGAQFHPGGDNIIVTGRRPFIYIYDVQSGSINKSPGIWGREETSWEKFSFSPCGQYIAFLGTNGNIVLVSYLTMQWIANFRMNGQVSCVSWSADSKYLYSSGVQGEIYQWDVAQRECVHKWVDDGSLGTTTLAVSPNEKYYAAGSTSGIVNIYDESALSREITRPTPYKSIGNLTTRITNMKFNYDSQLLAIASSDKKDALKLVHPPTGRVVVNWPTERTPLNRVSAMDFSPSSEYFTVGTKRGRVLLFNIKDYSLN